MNELRIYPCLWFAHEAEAAAAFYAATFAEGVIFSSSPQTVSFSIGGTRFLALNGNPGTPISPAVSYFVYCGGEAEIDRLYAALSEGGKVLMPLQGYDWSARYAWVEDRFGVNWQLDIDPVRSTQTIVPCLLFANEKMHRAQAAVEAYTRIFPGSRKLMETPFPPESGVATGALMFAQVKLGDFLLNVMSSTQAHDFDFSPGNSIVVTCDTQAQIDYFWEQLGQGGSFDRCGWLKDAFGVSWQVVPSVLPQLMADPARAPQVVAAFLQMQKFDIAALLDA
ncbi:MAG: VOC family protein [Bacteroidia bacterium]